ncbi:MAG: hypothetical protein U0231_08290 [Nitrospiraceae bacterium]
MTNSKTAGIDSIPIPAGRWLPLLILVAGILTVLFAPGQDALAKTKQKTVPRPEPELKILELHASPIPYHPNSGPFHFSARIQLPKEVDETLMLEVSALLTSPSMTSLRFLSDRQPIHAHQSVGHNSGSADALPKQVQIELVWDGLDHNKLPAPPGPYEYEVRAKLLSNGDKGQRTQMLSWPKRGTVAVK